MPARALSFASTPPKTVEVLSCQDSPAGRVTVGLTQDHKICRVAFGAARGWDKEWPSTAFIQTGKTIPFSDLSALKVLLIGTAFQRKVWQALLAIPSGQTETYGDLARRIGQPKAARAVGGALGKNPVPVLVPCHRVIASGGKLGGFGGGKALKMKLLNAEKDIS